MPCQTSAWGCMLQSALFLVYFIASETAKNGLSTVSDLSILPAGWAKRSWREYGVGRYVFLGFREPFNYPVLKDNFCSHGVHRIGKGKLSLYFTMNEDL